MMGTSELDALRGAIDSDRPFAMIATPGSEDWRMYSAEGTEPGDLTIYPFGKGLDKSGTTLHRCSSLTGGSPSVFDKAVMQDDTEREQYLKTIGAVVDILKESHGKTVVSRIKNIVATKHPADVARTYFAKHPQTSRYIFRASDGGLWFGATPELIVRKQPDGRVTTLALAGTRRRGCHQDGWDSKNTDEHRFVIDHIASTLTNLELDIDSVRDTTMTFGPIEHKATVIEASGPDVDIHRLTLSLSPTPAISGYPVDEALEMIAKMEKHNRGYYGGELVIDNDGVAESYLCLRCASAVLLDVPDEKTKSYGYTLYGGGGITEMSDPTAEWEETELKMQSLSEAITNS